MPSPPTHPGVFIHESDGPTPIVGVPTSITAFVGVARSGPLNEPVKILSWNEFEQEFGGIWRVSLLSYAVYQYFLNGGSIAIIVRINSALDLPGDRNARTGVYALQQVDIFNWLVIPPTDEDTELNPAQILLPALRFCRERSSMLIVDAPYDWRVATDVAEKMRAGEMSALTDDAAASCAALYFPWMNIADPVDGSTVEIPPCGAVAGVVARIDGTGGVWKAPAGIEATLKGVVSLCHRVSDKENSTLNLLHVNVLREFPNVGRVVWGARTLESAGQQLGEYKYIPIRRLSLSIEESLRRGLKWVAFEPNSDSLLTEIRLRVGAFLQRLFTQGAFQGAVATQAYFVKCDYDTNPPHEGASGVINVIVGFAALKPAEFIVLKIQLPHPQ